MQKGHVMWIHEAKALSTVFFFFYLFIYEKRFMRCPWLVFQIFKQFLFFFIQRWN